MIVSRALMAGVVALGALAGCDRGGDPRPSQQSIVQANAVEREAAGPPVEEPLAGRSPIQAEPSVRSPGFARCEDWSDGVTVFMGDCSSSEYAYWQVVLNKSYQDALARLDQAGRAKLQREQRQWDLRRNATCRNISPNKGGTAERLDILDCSNDWMADRVRHLRRPGAGPAPDEVWVRDADTAVRIATAVLEGYLGPARLSEFTEGRPIVARQEGDAWIVGLQEPVPNIASTGSRDTDGPVVEIGWDGRIRRISSSQRPGLPKAG